MAPISIDGTDISSLTIDGTEVQEVTVDGDVAWVATNKVHHWPMKEGSGSTLYDTVGSNDGTINSATWTSGTWIDDYALNFDEDGDVVMDPVSVIDLNKEFSIAVTIGEGSYGTILAQKNDDGSYLVLDIDETTDFDDYYEVNLLFGDSDENLIVEQQWQQEGELNNKVRIVFNYNGSESGTLYANTEEYQWDETNTSGSRPGGGSFFHLGAYSEESYTFSGDIDNVIVREEQLSSSEIQDDYDQQPWS